MKISREEEQGLRLSMTLAEKGGQMTLPELSAREGLSEALVAKILAKLRRGGVVRAVRGRNGGYELTAQPAEIPISTVICALGVPVFRGCGDDSEQACEHERRCDEPGHCGLHGMWGFLAERVNQIFDAITLADLVNREATVREQVYALWPRLGLDAEVGKDRPFAGASLTGTEN